MIISNVRLTANLRAWIEASHDDREPPLTCYQVDRSVVVHGRDHRGCARPLSEPEELEVRAVVAAHRADSLGPCLRKRGPAPRPGKGRRAPVREAPYEPLNEEAMAEQIREWIAKHDIR